MTMSHQIENKNEWIEITKKKNGNSGVKKYHGQKWEKNLLIIINDTNRRRNRAL